MAAESKKKKEKIVYFSLEPILKYKNALYYFIYGERSNGKTYQMLLYCLRQFIEHGFTSVYLRRYSMDLDRENLLDVFPNVVNNGEIDKMSKGLYSDVEIRSNRFYLIQRDELGKIIRRSSVFMHCVALVDAEHKKGGSDPNVRTIWFDEFIASSETGYLATEWTCFKSIVATYVRLRNDVKIFLTGNTNNRYSLYFREFRMTNIRTQKKDTIDIYHYQQEDGQILEIACQYTESMVSKGSKPSSIYFAFDNKNTKMITEGDWDIPSYPHLLRKYEEKDVIYRFYIEFHDEKFTCNIIQQKQDVFMFIHRKTTPIKETENIVYSTNDSVAFNYRKCLTKNTGIVEKKIIYLFQINKVFYQDNMVGDSIANYLNWSRQN